MAHESKALGLKNVLGLTLGDSLCETTRPPIGLKPCIFVRGPDHERKQQVLEAIQRYLDAELCLPTIWWMELYSHKLVPNGCILGAEAVSGGIHFHFDNKMSVFVHASDEQNVVHSARSEYDTYLAELEATIGEQ